MAMPILPGLVGGNNGEGTPDMGGQGGGEGDGLAAIIDQLEPDAVMGLVGEAMEALAAGSLDDFLAEAEETPAAEAAETPEQQATEEAAGTEQPMVDPQSAATNVAAVAGEIAQKEAELSELAGLAKDSDEGDEKVIKKALTTVSGLLSDAEKLQKDAEKAADDGDAETVSELATKAEELLAEATTACEEAKTAAKEQVEGAKTEPSPLALWAEKNA